jgi:hypothetical protein
VRQGAKGGKDFVLLGEVEINLAEFAGMREQSRRYLLQKSRINATLKISTKKKQTKKQQLRNILTSSTIAVKSILVEGDPVFKVYE